MVTNNVSNLKENKNLYLFNWLSVNCDTRIVKNFGLLSTNGVFEKIPPSIATKGTSWDWLTTFFCGTSKVHKFFNINLSLRRTTRMYGVINIFLSN